MNQAPAKAPKDHNQVFQNAAADSDLDRVFLDNKMSSQMKELEFASIAALFWGIWVQRNSYKFDDKNPNFEQLCTCAFASSVGWLRPIVLLKEKCVTRSMI